MNFEPSWTEDLVAKTARDFAARELAPRAAERDRRGLFPEQEMRALGALGLLGLCVPEAQGGAGAGAAAQAMAIAEIAAADASVAVTMSVTNMVAEIVARHATEEVRGRALPRLCSGDAVAGSFALSEPQAGSDARAIATTARRVDGGYRISGAKQWITSGDRAGVIVVMARHEADHPTSAGERRISAFVLEPPVAGLSAGPHERKLGLRGSSTVPLVLDDVFVAESARLGREGDGFRVALGALDGGRISVAAQAVGIARGALDAAISYARERRQFDQPIARFQAIRMMIADSATALEAAWMLVLAAAWAKDNGLPVTRAAAQAKLFATERAVEVCDRALQIHGGYGYTRDFPVERHVRDVRVTTIYEGTSQIQRLVIAKQILREVEPSHV